MGLGMEMGLGMGSWAKRCSFAGVIKLRFSDGTENWGTERMQKQGALAF